MSEYEPPDPIVTGEYMTNELVILAITLLFQIEAGGNEHPKDGDGGRAVGPLQMHVEMVDEVNRLFKTKYSYADRRSFTKSVEMAKLWLTYIAERDHITLVHKLVARWNMPYTGKVAYAYRLRTAKIWCDNLTRRRNAVRSRS